MQRGSLIKKSLNFNEESDLTDTGVLCVRSGDHKGRSPNGKYIVRDSETDKTVDWSANQEMSQSSWNALMGSVQTYIEAHSEYGREFFNIKRTAGKATRWVNRTRKTFNFICENPTQALFIKNMFGECDHTAANDIEAEVYCLPGLAKEPKVVLNLKEKKIIIAGTKYLGEIKKSVFTYMNYVLTDSSVLPMHCSVNTDSNFQNPAIFFGLSGTGKTTLSASPDRVLLGDDEHGWTKGVIFNIESGCYAKTINLSPESEPEIFNACQKFGTILENVKIKNGSPDFFDVSLTANGRASYPIHFIEKHVPDGFVTSNPKNVIMLTCDATGVLPPVAKLTISQAKKMFLVGYTSKVAGTEVGVVEPELVFSPCFGAPFLPRNPSVYADMLHSLIDSTNANCWLVNTGWSGGPPGVGNRTDLTVTRKIIDSIVNEKLISSEWLYHEQTGLTIPDRIPGTDFSTRPEHNWDSLDDYNESASTLMGEIESKIKEIL